MPALANARHERFAQERASGKSIDDAYVAAGFKANRGNASRLNANEGVQHRIAEILGNAAAKVEIDQAYVLSTIHSTVERCKQAVPVLDRRGEIVLTETPTGDLAPAYTFDAKSVLRGAELLGKHLGMFRERIEHTGKDGEPLALGDTDLARLIVFELTRASKEA